MTKQHDVEVILALCQDHMSSFSSLALKPNSSTRSALLEQLAVELRKEVTHPDYVRCSFLPHAGSHLLHEIRQHAPLDDARLTGLGMGSSAL